MPRRDLRSHIAIAALASVLATGAAAQERTLKICGFGANSGVVRLFGLNSQAAMKAGAEPISKAGGVTLADLPWLPSLPALDALSQALRTRPAVAKTLPY